MTYIIQELMGNYFIVDETGYVIAMCRKHADAEIIVAKLNYGKVSTGKDDIK